MLPDRAQVKQLLELSGERDMWRQAADQAFRRGFSVGYDTGFNAGYARCEADYETSWRTFAGPIAHPERYAAERLRNALAFSRREAGEHERLFVARAYATGRHDRTDAQQACVMSYPPPARGP
jgi:hypothetical protein